MLCSIFAAKRFEDVDDYNTWQTAILFNDSKESEEYLFMKTMPTAQN